MKSKQFFKAKPIVAKAERDMMMCFGWDGVGGIDCNAYRINF